MSFSFYHCFGLFMFIHFRFFYKFLSITKNKFSLFDTRKKTVRESIKESEERKQGEKVIRN